MVADRSATPEGFRRVRWQALGCLCEIVWDASGNNSTASLQIEHSLIDWVEGFEAAYSRFRSDSLLSRINQSAGGDWVAIDQETELMLDLCDSLNFVTRGVLDPTASPLVKLYYKAERPPEAEAVRAAMGLVGWRKVERRSGAIRLPSGMSIDFGGFGKEYAVDRVAGFLTDEFGVSNFLINLGNDIRVSGHPGEREFWQVGVESPFEPDQLLTSIALTDGAVAASGDYRRFFISGGKRFGHIVDPRTGYPVANRCRAVHLIGGNCLEAGIHSTSVFILGIPDGLDLVDTTFGLEGIIICENESFRSQNFHLYEIT